jgi:hypothetical protein
VSQKYDIVPSFCTISKQVSAHTFIETVGFFYLEKENGEIADRSAEL